MVTDRPTASLTGKEDWEWNERHAGGSSSDTSKHHRNDSNGPDRKAALRREIRELEAELERTENRLQCVIDRYERLLTEKNRKLNDCGDSGKADTGLLLPSWWPTD